MEMTFAIFKMLPIYSIMSQLRHMCCILLVSRQLCEPVNHLCLHVVDIDHRCKPSQHRLRWTTLNAPSLQLHSYESRFSVWKCAEYGIVVRFSRPNLVSFRLSTNPVAKAEGWLNFLSASAQPMTRSALELKKNRWDNYREFKSYGCFIQNLW